MSIKYFVLLVLVIFTTTFTSQQAQQKQPPSPEDIQAFEKLLEEIISEIEEEGGKEEIERSAPEKPVKPSKTDKPEKSEKEIEREEKEKEAFIQNYIPQLIKNFSSAKQTIASLEEHKKAKFNPYQKDLAEIVRYLREIEESDIYQNSLMDKKFIQLRGQIKKMNSALSSINRDLSHIAQDKEEIIIEELYKAKEGEPERKVKRRTTPEELKEQIKIKAKEKEAEIKRKLEEQKTVKKVPAPTPIKKEATLPWYKKLLSPFQKAWSRITGWFQKSKEIEKTVIVKEEIKVVEEKPVATLEAGEETEQKQEIKPQKHILEMMKAAEAEMEKNGKKRTAPTLQKRAINDLLNLFKRELKQFHNQLKSLIDFSAKTVEEARKKQEEKEKAAEQKRKQMEQKEQRYTPSQQYYPSSKYGDDYSPSYRTPSYSSPSYRPPSRRPSYKRPEDVTTTTPSSKGSGMAKPGQASTTSAGKKEEKEKSKGKPLTAPKETPLAKEKRLKNRIIKLVKELDSKYLEKIESAQNAMLSNEAISNKETLLSNLQTDLKEIRNTKLDLEDVTDLFTTEDRKKITNWTNLNSKYEEAVKTYEALREFVIKLENYKPDVSPTEEPTTKTVETAKEEKKEETTPTAEEPETSPVETGTEEPISEIGTQTTETQKERTKRAPQTGIGSLAHPSGYSK